MNYRRCACFIGFLLELITLLSAFSAIAEQLIWDCQKCGRTGNTGNYCGGCAHPAPWIQTEEVNAASTQDFRTKGNIVTFGHYEQDNDAGNGAEKIEWIVLDYDEKDNKALLLSVYGLDTMPYNKTNVLVSWEESSIRKWLNDDFIKLSFTEKEKAAVLMTLVDNSSSQGSNGWVNVGWENDSSENTQDQIFLLSYSEVHKYLKATIDNSDNLKSRAAPTIYAISQGAHVSIINKTDTGSSAGWWWLRSSGYLIETYYKARYAEYIEDKGSVGRVSMYYRTGLVRPALWINVNILNSF